MLRGLGWIATGRRDDRRARPRGAAGPCRLSRVTLLFTDVEGSTRLARELGDAWPEVVADHHRIVRDAIAGRGGRVEREAGDAFLASVRSGARRRRGGGRRAARAGRARLAAGRGELRVRMGIHTGAVDRSRGDLTGLDIHLAARVEAAAHGGQVVLTAATRRDRRRASSWPTSASTG